MAIHTYTALWIKNGIDKAKLRLVELEERRDRTWYYFYSLCQSQTHTDEELHRALWSWERAFDRAAETRRQLDNYEEREREAERIKNGEW